MANTYTQLNYHIVFSVRKREIRIPKEHKEELHKYIAGIFRNQKSKLLCINSMPDHIHILAGIHPEIALSDFVRDIKSHSSGLVNDKKWIRGKFRWQEGYGAFTYSQSHLPRVIRYIENQEKHHKVKTFRQEFLEMLEGFKISYDPKYISDID